MTTTFPITAEHFRRIQSPAGMRMELVRGEITLSPSPRPRHSLVVMNLMLILGPYVRAHKLGEILPELDTELSEIDVRCPDLLFIKRDRLIKLDLDEPVSKTDAHLVIEVVSPRSAKIDREDKFKQYAEAGIPFYWIIDPRKQTAEGFVLAGKEYTPAMKGSGDETFSSPPFEGLEISLAALWARPQ